MEEFIIILTPANDEDLVHGWKVNCKDVDAARDQANAYLAMAGSRFKDAIVLSHWKSETAWRQAKHKICNNFNL